MYKLSPAERTVFSLCMPRNTHGNGLSTARDVHGVNQFTKLNYVHRARNIYPNSRRRTSRMFLAYRFYTLRAAAVHPFLESQHYTNLFSPS